MMNIPEIGSIWMLNRKRDLAPFQYDLRYEVIGTSQERVTVQATGEELTYEYDLEEFYTLLEPAEETDRAIQDWKASVWRDFLREDDEFTQFNGNYPYAQADPDEQEPDEWPFNPYLLGPEDLY